MLEGNRGGGPHAPPVHAAERTQSQTAGSSGADAAGISRLQNLNEKHDNSQANANMSTLELGESEQISRIGARRRGSRSNCFQRWEEQPDEMKLSA